MATLFAGGHLAGCSRSSGRVHPPGRQPRRGRQRVPQGWLSQRDPKWKQLWTDDFGRGGRRQQFGKVMSSGANISTLYREFTQTLTDVLAEHAVGPASRGRLARARAAVKKHPEYSEHGYFLAVETAFQRWEALQAGGHMERPSPPGETTVE